MMIFAIILHIILTMSVSYKDSSKALVLGARLRAARKDMGLTLTQLGSQTKIDHSQISRIERGGFKGLSKNVQILCTFLTTNPAEGPLSSSPSNLAKRLERIASVSPKWETAVASFVEAMEAAQEGESNHSR